MSNPRISYSLADSGPTLPAIDGKRVIVHVVVNVETWLFDEPLPRKLLGSPHGRERIPDIPNFSWVEYGMRCGLPRLFEALDGRGIHASASLNASVIDHYPAAAARIKQLGWEVIAHGLNQRALPDHDDERSIIDDTLSRIEAFFGSRPRGWLGPGLAESFDTPDYLSAAGIEYTCDWVIDDLPVRLEASPRPLVAIPYALELNDSVLYAAQWFSASEFETRVAATLARFKIESARGPRVLTLGLHPHLIGVPHRIAALERALDLLRNDDQVVFVTGSAICDWFTAAQLP